MLHLAHSLTTPQGTTQKIDANLTKSTFPSCSKIAQMSHRTCPSCGAGVENFVGGNENAATCSQCGTVVDDQNYSYADAAVHEPEDISNKRGEAKERSYASPLVEALYSHRTTTTIVSGTGSDAPTRLQLRNHASSSSSTQQESQVELVKKSGDTYRRYCRDMKNIAANLGFGENIVILAHEKFLTAAVRKKRNARALEALALVALYHSSKESAVPREIGEMTMAAKESVGWDLSSKLFSKAIRVYAQIRNETAQPIPTLGAEGATTTTTGDAKMSLMQNQTSAAAPQLATVAAHGTSEGKAEFSRRICSQLKWSSKATVEAAKRARLLGAHYSSHRAGTVAAAALILTQKKFPKEPGTPDEICDLCGVGKPTVLKMLKDQEALQLD